MADLEQISGTQKSLNPLIQVNKVKHRAGEEIVLGYHPS